MSQSCRTHRLSCKIRCGANRDYAEYGLGRIIKTKKVPAEAGTFEDPKDHPFSGAGLWAAANELVLECQEVKDIADIGACRGIDVTGA